MRTVAALCRELITDHRPDGELLAAFLDGPSEDAFAELVRRRGPLVWGACRRLLPDPADAEDTFQTAFLVLVRRARRLTSVPDLGPWLHRVAVWTARNVRRKNARRLARQTDLPDHVTDPTPAPDPHLKVDLDAALLALPTRYRDPIVLCHLLGLSRREAAERLGCPEGTLSARLSRGLTKLRHKLRGLDPALALTGAAVAVPTALTASTTRAAVATAAAGCLPPAVSQLVEGVLHMFWIKKATAATLALCATFALGVGVGLGTRAEQTAAVAREDAPPPHHPAPKADVPAVTAEYAAITAEIEALERYIARSEGLRGVHLAAIDAAKCRLKAGPKDFDEELERLNQHQRAADQFETNVKVVREQLAAAKAARAKMQPPAQPKEEPKPDEKRRFAEQCAEQERLIRETYQRLADAQAKAEESRRQAETHNAQANKLKTEIDILRARLDEMRAREAATADTGGYLELTISVKAGTFEFILTEVPAGNPNERGLQTVLGPVTTRDPAMLRKLLTRTRSDATAPKELRVVASAQATWTSSLPAALKACDTAGYTTVKFTGYVFQGAGYAPPLAPDETGDAAGYKRHDKTERKTAELLQEIEEHARRY